MILKESCKVYMTHPTKAILKPLLSDYLRVTSMATRHSLYTEAELSTCMDKIDVAKYKEEVFENGIKFTCYNAGHVLGAAMFMIEIGGVKIL
jgi:cleavage and polyadenylation specificity factor subunit 3